MVPHAALDNADILYEIFTHLTLPRRGDTWTRIPATEPGNRRALASAALCCKAFSSPALDALWWKLDDICHLFRLLPAFQRSGREYILDGKITEYDLEIFDSYAKRVRTLVFHDFGTIHPTVYLRLSQLKKFSPLLPSVQTIDSMPGGSGLLSVLSNSLLELCIHPDTQNQIFPTVWVCIEALPQSAPMIRKLHVQAIISRSCFNAFSRMNNLQNLSLLNTGAGDLSFFYTLAQLEHLETLQLSDFEEPTSVLLPLVDGGALTYRPFPALKHLDINLPPAQLISLLKIFKQHPLQRLELRHYKHATPNGPDTSSYWAQVLRSVAGKFYSLKNLTMASTSAEVEDSFLSNNIYEPLLDMRGLESVNLDFPWPPFLDADFKKMASAWPELSTLRLAGLATAAPKATFAALEVLAMGCPKLHGLSLSFNACQLPSSDDTSVSCSKVKTLDAQHSPTDNALFTARHLDRLFPHLKTIQSTVQQKIWGEVGDLLRTFKAVRMDQKARDFQTMKRARPARRVNVLD